ncbi:hypothetical protein [Marinoscillum sp.]|uniref:hypothetical protein n=1 Tax=Marinoscillum sp. TaxID=2024838 RepID=UPI003BAA18FD
MRILLIFFFALFANSCWSQNVIGFIDGQISPVELETSKEIYTDDISSLRVEISEWFLKVYVKAEEMYVASICICQGDQVDVFHASAALGKISYAREGDRWVTNDSFVFSMRETAMDLETIKLRENYFRENGWLANTMEMGEKGEVEFILDKSQFSGSTLKIANGIMLASDPENILGQPSQANDCVAHSLVSGSPKSSYQFVPEDWIGLTIP